MRVGRHCPGRTRASPRASVVPGHARQVHRHPAPRLHPGTGPAGGSAGPAPAPCGPPGDVTSSSSTARAPPARVPVTTVPDPLAANTRSTHSRGRPRSTAAGRDVEQPVEGGPQLVDPLARGHVDLDHLGPVEERARHHVGQLHAGQLPGLGVDQADLGQGHQPVADAQQLEDAQVLLGLGLPPLGGGHHEQARLHRTHPGQHVLEEPDVAGHVDEGQLPARRQRRPGEAEVDGEAPGLLLGEAVGVHPGEAQDEGGLAVVDVPGGGDDGHHAARQLVTLSALCGVSVRPGRMGRPAEGLGQDGVVGGVDGAQVETVSPSWTRATIGGSLARRAAAWSPATATPADGTSWPGTDPPPATATVAHGRPTPKPSARRHSSVHRRGRHPPEGDGHAVAAQVGQGRLLEGGQHQPARAAGPGSAGGGRRRPPGRPGRR